MTQVEHDISDFEEAGEAVPGGVPERQWHHHVEDDELSRDGKKISRDSPALLPLPAASHHFPPEPQKCRFSGLFLEFRLCRLELASLPHKSSHEPA